MRLDIPTIISPQIWGHPTQGRWVSLNGYGPFGPDPHCYWGLIASSLRAGLCYIVTNCLVSRCMRQDIPTIISPQIWGHPTQGRWVSLMATDHLDLTLTVIEGLLHPHKGWRLLYYDYTFGKLTQQNSSCRHCAVTGQWRCGDYPFNY